MKKNLIISLLALLLVVMTITAYFQKIRADDAMEITTESTERAEMYQMRAEQAQVMADHQARNAQMAMEEAAISSELSRIEVERIKLINQP